MDGIAALREIRERDAHVPVVIVSGVDDPQYTEEALALGATNFIRKPFDKAEIRFVAERIRGALSEEADVRPALDLLVERRTVFEMGNDLDRLSKVVAYLGRELRLHYPGYDVPSTEVKLALYEALANAVEHGNLEITYDEKTKALATEGGITALIESRRSKEPYRGRRVRVEALYETARVTYRVSDAGPGFRVREYEATHSLADTSALHGRGILLIRHYMGEVKWNDAGNVITMSLPVTLRRTSDSGSHPAPP
jgi:anti-sigma regulatory factor (Ser/Thr protein kinase)